MRTGIILEMDESFLTLLTPEGEFLRARRKGKTYLIGQEITFEPAIQSHEKRNTVGKLAGMKRIWMSAAAALIIMASAIIPLNSGSQVYAYMSIDVNPSIELGLNDKMQVLKMSGYNPEGEKIVSGLKDWKKEDASEVAEKILYEIGRQGYFAETNNVIISAVQTGEKEDKADLRLKETIEEISETAKKEEHEVTVVSASPKDLKEARKLGVTTGNYKAGASAAIQSEEKPASKDAPTATNSAVPSKEGKASAPGQSKKADPGKPVVPLKQENKGNGHTNSKAEAGKGKHETKPKENKGSQKAETKNNGKDNKKNGDSNGKGNSKEQNNGNDKGNSVGKKGSDVKGGDPKKQKDNQNGKNNGKGNSNQKPSPQSNQNTGSKKHDSENKGKGNASSNGEKGNSIKENNGQQKKDKNGYKGNNDPQKNGGQDTNDDYKEKGKSGK
ncbi:hypothetical protein DRW41_01975 [Neobacillus piezotolerans]|uniref:RsgI N-terminal anti-sigma domain-containing protein n=1 Tax=Neobacillus piezotolerans TaxID=2259171 RepID=A0A3D8GVY3_9BACI|nr:anti-sigma factor domain-containing protein [Neobacillus piezotolerans]RDU38359.1 hypothetical protein DRW41_01975 [Neobacillus piezotolerans]